jgi:addiction module RelB/DinJ family antitoxin
MSLIVRTANIQARVVPAIKEASERVLWRIGLNMSEAMELFLRRVIIDEKLPFEVAALSAEMMPGNVEVQGESKASKTRTRKRAASRKKNSKKF